MANQFSLNDLLVIDSSGRVGIGVTAPSSKLHVTGSGATSSTSTMRLLNSSGVDLFFVRDDGNVGVGTVSPTNKFSVVGTFAATGSILPGADNTYSLGSTASRWLTVNASFISGSLTRLADGSSYLVAGSNVTISSSSNGQVVISAASSGGGGDPNASYLVLTSTASLTNENVFGVGTGLDFVSAGSNYTVSINNNVVATVTGSRFTGPTTHLVGMSGSLTQLSDGRSYLVAGSGVTIASSSNGQVVLSATGGSSSPTVTRLTGSATISAGRNHLIIVRQPVALTIVTLAHISSSWQDGDTVEVKLRGNSTFQSMYVSSSNKFDGGNTLYGPLADGEAVTLRADLTYGEWIIV